MAGTFFRVFPALEPCAYNRQALQLLSLQCQCSPGHSSPPPPLKRRCSPLSEPSSCLQVSSSQIWNLSHFLELFPEGQGQALGLSGRVSSLCFPLFLASSSVGPLTQLTPSLPPPSQPGLSTSRSRSHSPRPPSLLLLFPLKWRPTVIKTVRAREHHSL